MRESYLSALASADEALRTEKLDFSEMEALLRGALAKQLLSVIDAADGQIS